MMLGRPFCIRDRPNLFCCPWDGRYVSDALRVVAILTLFLLYFLDGTCRFIRVDFFSSLFSHKNAFSSVKSSDTFELHSSLAA